jgi:hypothetical protein
MKARQLAAILFMYNLSKEMRYAGDFFTPRSYILRSDHLVKQAIIHRCSCSISSNPPQVNFIVPLNLP